MVTITNEDMLSRSRIAKLQSAITDAMSSVYEKDGSVTYAEVCYALAQASVRWTGYWLKEERNEEKGGAK